MNTQADQNRLCRRVTTQGEPCRNKARIGADYCLIHSISERHGWGFYAGWIGSVASIVSLVLVFLANEPNTSNIHSPGSVDHERQESSNSESESRIAARISGPRKDYLLTIDHSLWLRFDLLIDNISPSFVALDSIGISLDDG